MPKVSAKVAPYVSARFSRWLQRSLDASGIAPGALAAASRTGDSPPRSAVAGYRDGTRTPTPMSAFNIGQAFAFAGLAPGEPYEPRPGGDPTLDSYRPSLRRPPVPGGLMGLFAAGYFSDALALVIALLDSERPDDRAYAARFASTCWTANADLDNGGDQKVKANVRESMRRFIGDAPVESIEKAWQTCQRSGPLERALVAFGDAATLTSTEHEDDAIYYGAVLEWHALIGLISLRARHDTVLAANWKYVQRGFEEYWKGVVLSRD